MPKRVTLKPGDAVELTENTLCDVGFGAARRRRSFQAGHQFTLLRLAKTDGGVAIVRDADGERWPVPADRLEPVRADEVA